MPDPRRKPPALPANESWPDWLRDLWGPPPEGPRLRAEAIEAERRRRAEREAERDV